MTEKRQNCKLNKTETPKLNSFVHVHQRGSTLSDVIGASLSKPHTSVTSLRTCVCMFACLDRPLTENLKSADFMCMCKIDI